VQKKAVTQPAAQPKAQPLAIADPTPSPNAPAGSLAQDLASTPAPVAAAPAAPPAPPASPVVQLPSSNADYLQNPKPAYPPLSKRLGEQGRVMVRVLIGADGVPQKAELRQSSGFERLDQVALSTVLKWRYVPGKRGGVAEEMWFNLTINFVLE
ncbi:MAG: energy transducer TonB, partial [Polaromonas sp.]